MAIVYQHTRNDNGNVFYIGIGANVKRAYSDIGRNPHWQSVVKKARYTISITHENICWEEACSIEKYLISFWREQLGRENVTNITDGGDGVLGVRTTEAGRISRIKKLTGRIPSQETKDKISASLKGEKHFMFGKTHTLEAKAKISEASKGRKYTEEQNKRKSLIRTGEKRSDEAKLKMRLAKLGTKHSEETKLKMSQTKQKNKQLKTQSNVNTEDK